MSYLTRAKSILPSVLLVLLCSLQGFSSTTAQASAVTEQGAPRIRPIMSGWIPYWNISAGLAATTSHASVFSDVSPFFYSTTGVAPNIKITSKVSTPDATRVVAALHAAGLPTVPTITDNTASTQMSSQIATTAGRSTLIAQMVKLTDDYQYDGVDLDFEKFAFSDSQKTWPTTRIRWTSFIKALSTALHTRGKVLFVTVPAGLQTSADSTGYSVYAWSLIAPYIDRMRIMAYDYSVSKPGPIAPYSWVSQVAAHAVTQVDASKIQLGVPSYGRDWLSTKAGTCPNLPPAQATPSQASTMKSRLSWALTRHEYDTSWALKNVTSLFASDAATIPGVSLVKSASPSWDDTVKEQSYNYTVAFSGRLQLPPTTILPAASAAKSRTITVHDSRNLTAGFTIKGLGIASGTTVSAVKANTITLSKATADAVTGSLIASHSYVIPARGAKSVKTLTLSTTAHLIPGTRVSGTGIAAHAIVTTVSGKTVTLNLANTAAVASKATLTVVLPLTPAGALSGQSTLKLSSTTKVSLSSLVSGQGIAPTTHVISVSPNSVTLSLPATSDVTGPVTFTPAPKPTTCSLNRTGWYADSRSVMATAALIGSLHLAGIAQWTIGGEDPAQWSELTAYAAQIAPTPATIIVNGPTRLGTGQSGSFSSVVTFQGNMIAHARVVLDVQEVGSLTARRILTSTTDNLGHWNFTIPAQPASFTWTLTVFSNSWSRADTTETGKVDVTSPLEVTLTTSKTVSATQHPVVQALVKFHHSPISGVTLTAQVRSAASSTAPFVTAGHVVTDNSGSATVSLPVQSDDFVVLLTAAPLSDVQLPGTASATVGVTREAVISMSASATIASATKNALKGTVTFKGKPVSTPITIQVRPAGSSTWVTIAASTDANGAFSALLPAQTVNYDYRVLVPADSFTRLSSSSTAFVQVKLGVSALVRPAKLTAGKWHVVKNIKPVLYGKVTPFAAGCKVVLQIWQGSAWHNLVTTTTTSSGAYTATGSSMTTASAKYRVLAYPTTSQPNLANHSADVLLSSP